MSAYRVYERITNWWADLQDEAERRECEWIPKPDEDDSPRYTITPKGREMLKAGE